MTDVIRLTVPSTGQEELEEVATVLASGYLTQGPKVAEFEKVFAAYIGVRYAFATTSATTALHLSLDALAIDKGSTVIVPAFTFPATGNVVVQYGAKVAFSDISLDTFGVTAKTIESAVTEDTSAVMPVDPFGYPVDMESIVELADERGIKVIEDAACAIGAYRNGRSSGSFRDVGCFSFHPRKVITTGEGGMITTDDEEIADRITVLRNHGARREAGGNVYVDIGYNYRLSDVQGAIGLAQMRKLQWILDQRRSLAHDLKAMLAVDERIRTPQVEPACEPTYQSFVILLPSKDIRDGLIAQLAAVGIESTIGTYGLHLQPVFEDMYGSQREQLPNATIAAEQSLTLPLYPSMTDSVLDRIATGVINGLDNLS